MSTRLLLIVVVLAYMILAIADAYNVAKELRGPDRIWCGNTITDPHIFVLNAETPFATAAVSGVTWYTAGARKRLGWCWAFAALFGLVTAGLLGETQWLEKRFGLEVWDAVWWLRWLRFT